MFHLSAVRSIAHISDSVRLFTGLCIVPVIHGSHQISGDSSDSLKGDIRKGIIQIRMVAINMDVQPLSFLPCFSSKYVTYARASASGAFPVSIMVNSPSDLLDIVNYTLISGNVNLYLVFLHSFSSLANHIDMIYIWYIMNFTCQKSTICIVI